MRSIASSKGRSSNTMDFNRRAFVAQQERKRRKWKREDEVRLSGMNLPSLSPREVERRPSADVMYHSSGNDVGRGSFSCGRKPILPMMKVQRERTEIILHNNRTFITKLPTFVQIDENIEKIFDAYRGTAFLARDLPSRDERFTRLQRSLQSSLPPTDDQQSAYENSVARGRLVKNKWSSESPTNSEPVINQHAEARVMIASRGQSRNMARSAPTVEFVTETKSAGLKRAEILQSFKTQDIKELSKSLTRESQIEPDDLKSGEGAFLPKEKSILKTSSHTNDTNTREVTSLGLQYKVRPK